MKSPELFIKTRRTPPTRIVIDIDATDDPTHDGQQLSLFHGHYRQHQYLSQLIFDSETKFPLAGWLCSGTAHPSWGAVEALQEIVRMLREVWLDVEIVVRGDGGYASPELYEYCEAETLKYAIGYGANNVLKRQTQLTLNYVQAIAKLYDEPVQRFQDVWDYQAESWDRPRRIIAKCEVTAQGGPNRRFVVTNLTGTAEEIYRGTYVQRGDGAERAIQELKHGLQIDRLSSHRFFANAFAMQCQLLAYALYVLFREANAAVPEVAEHTLETVRARVFKAGALVKTTSRKVWFHISANWPGRDALLRIAAAVKEFAQQLGRLWPDRLAERLSIKLGGPVTLLK